MLPQPPPPRAPPRLAPCAAATERLDTLIYDTVMHNRHCLMGALLSLFLCSFPYVTHSSHSRFFHNSLWYMTSHVHDVHAPRTTCPLRAVIYRSILAHPWSSSIFHPKRTPFFIFGIDQHVCSSAAQLFFYHISFSSYFLFCCRNHCLEYCIQYFLVTKLFDSFTLQLD